MDEILSRFWEHLGGRAGGPMTFRLVLQPATAAFFAIREGLRDARDGRPAWLWAVATDPSQRRALLHEAWRSIGRIFVFAVAIDVVYQLWMFGWIYPLELVLVAVLLALVPYALLRGPVNRIARRVLRERGASR